MLDRSNKFSSFLLAYHPGTVQDLPVLSPFARALLEKPLAQYTEDELVTAFETDPFLSAKLFGVANSIFFDLNHRPIYTVREALERVGFEYAANLMRQAPYFSAECDANKLHDVWTHCIGVAHAAKELAKLAAPLINGDAVFLVALIHDIGYLIEIHYDPTRLPSVVQQLHEKESHAGAQSHVALGESLADFWSLPENAREAIRWHHRPNQCGGSAEARFLAAIIALADAIVGYCLDGRELEVDGCAAALSAADLTASQFRQVANELMSIRERWACAIP